MAIAHAGILYCRHSRKGEHMDSEHATLEGWQLERSSADAYERYLAAAFAPWAQALVGLAAVAEGERVLDVACGTGIVARSAAPRVGPSGTVAGVDFNGEMLRVARAVSAGTRPAIDWRQANAASLPFPPASFDASFCEQALQFFTDPGAAVREMHRVLAPGGRAAVTVCRAIEHSPVYLALADALERFAGREAGAMMRSPFSSWTVARLRGLFTDAGFSTVHVTIDVGAIRYPSAAELLRREAASSPLAGPIGALSAERRRALIDELQVATRDYVDDNGVMCSVESYVVLAKKAA